MTIYYASVETSGILPGGLVPFPFASEKDDAHDMHSRRNSDGTWNAGESSPFITAPADGIAWISAWTSTGGETILVDGNPIHGNIARIRAGQTIALSEPGGANAARLAVAVHTDIEQPDEEKIRVRVGTDPYADVVEPAPMGETGTGDQPAPDWPK